MKGESGFLYLYLDYVDSTPWLKLVTAGFPLILNLV